MPFYLFFLITVLILFYIFDFPQLGKQPKGERLQRIKNSPNYKNKKFQNISYTPDLKEGVTYFNIAKAFITTPKANKKPRVALPSLKVDLKNITSKEPFLVWFGHSSYYLQIDDFKILVDPVFSGSASPFNFMVKSFDGTNIYSAEDFPELDVLLITHDHFDHLDYDTVKKLLPKVNKVITSLGVGSHLERWGYNTEDIIELDWYETVTINQSFVFTATPSRHFSGRTLERNTTLWSSFVLKTPQLNLFLGGDSGYDTHFKTIGEKFGPFDLAILECGQYNDYWHYIHMLPNEVIKAAKDLNAKQLLPVHWGKFKLALHNWDEPINEVLKEAEKENVNTLHPKIGEQLFFTTNQTQQKWWL